MGVLTSSPHSVLVPKLYPNKVPVEHLLEICPQGLTSAAFPDQQNT